VADSDETEKVSDSVDAEKLTADATKNAGTAAVKAPMTVKEPNTETVDKTSCKECEAEFENVKDMRAHEVREHMVNSSPIPQIDGTNDSLERVDEKKEDTDNKVN
jgi:hypothetical protein